MSPAVADRPRSGTIAVRTAPSPVSASSPQLDPVRGFDSAPWLPSLLLQLNFFQSTGQNIPGVGDLRIAQATADRVRRFLSVVSVAPLPAPSLTPFSGGGLALTWQFAGRELSFSAYPGQDDFVFMRTDENDLPVADGFVSLDQTDCLAEVIAALFT